MSWTQGQQNRTNQSPFIDPSMEERTHSKPNSSGYSRPGGQRTDYNQRTPNTTARVPSPPQRDVAATFSQEGLQTFSTIFSSAVEAAIAKNLPDLFERVLDKKVEHLLLRAQAEMNQVLTQVAGQLVEEVKTQLRREFTPPIAHSPSTVEAAVENPQANDVIVGERTTAIEQSELALEPQTRDHLNQSNEANRPESAIQHEVASARKDDAEYPTVAAHDAEYESVLNALMKLGRPAKIEELREFVPDINWGKNPSVKMSGFMHKSGGQIERVSRGIYQYVAQPSGSK